VASRYILLVGHVLRSRKNVLLHRMEWTKMDALYLQFAFEIAVEHVVEGNNSLRAHVALRNKHGA
jgi:hypothetical protein